MPPPHFGSGRHGTEITRCEFWAGVGLFDRLMSERWNVCWWTGYLLMPVSGRVHGYQLRDGDWRVCVSSMSEQRDVSWLRQLVRLRVCSRLQRSILSDEWWGLHIEVRHAASVSTELVSRHPGVRHAASVSTEALPWHSGVRHSLPRLFLGTRPGHLFNRNVGPYFLSLLLLWSRLAISVM